MSDARRASEQDLSLTELVNELAAQRRLDLRGYKLGTLQRRMSKRMRQLNIASHADYLRRIQEDPTEVNELLHAVLINVTEFFRDPPAWEVLRTSVLPDLLGGMGSGDVFRAWCAGCASGEEPYSLAMLLAGYFGERLPERDIKIYATDNDEDALNVARRAEYPRERLRRVRPEWREKYLQGNGNTMRLIRELRRLVIFGRSNILADAPISHCNLVICRNLLIYFDNASQQQIFKRLHYALEPNGILFLGKAESKLSESQVFRAVSPRWRIFQKLAPADGEGRLGVREATMADPATNHAAEEELRRKKLEQRHLLDSLKSGVILLDGSDTVTTHNDAAMRILGIESTQLIGQKIQKTEIADRCPELPARLEGNHRAPVQANFRCWLKTPADGDERLISVTLKPILREDGHRTGTLMHCEDVTPQERLRATVEQLESTSEELQSSNEELETANEELQSTNEELETTNEELQSTNEELETTNEELQSTNEELETANEELQSLNEELENMNEELEHRTRELNEHTQRYAETLHSMPFPVILVDGGQKVQLWNAAAQKLLGASDTSVPGVELSQLPVSGKLLDALVQRCGSVLESRRAAVLSKQLVKPGSRQQFDIHITPVSRGDSGIDGVLIVFEPLSAAPAARSHGKARTEKKAAPAANRKSGSSNKRASRGKR